jgi:hypothetical protein
MTEALPDLVAIGEPLIKFNQRDPSRPDFSRGFSDDTPATR